MARSIISPFILRQQVSDDVRRMRTSLQPVKYSRRVHGYDDIANDIRYLFDMGGAISGGAALAYIKGRDTKDIDFYFNDEGKYLDAIKYAGDNPYIDINWYKIKPYELHDLSIVRVALWSNGIEISNEAQEAIDTNVSRIYADCFVYPSKTANRLLKYNDRYGTKYHRSEIIAICALFGYDDTIAQQLLSCAV